MIKQDIFNALDAFVLEYGYTKTLIIIRSHEDSELMPKLEQYVRTCYALEYNKEF